MPGSVSVFVACLVFWMVCVCGLVVCTSCVDHGGLLSAYSVYHSRVSSITVHIQVILVGNGR